MVDIAVERPVSFQKLASRLEVCDKTIHNWTKQGLEYLHLGGRYFTTFEAVQRFGLRGEHSRQTDPAASAAQSPKATTTHQAKRGLARRHGISVPGGRSANN